MSCKDSLNSLRECWTCLGVEGDFVMVNRIQGKYMLENKKLSDRNILYQFLRRIPIQNCTIAYDIVNRDFNEKQESKVPDNNVM